MVQVLPFSRVVAGVMLRHVWILIDDEPSPQTGVQIFFRLGILIALLIAGFVVVSQIRKRFREPDEPAATGFTLSDLRRLYKEGQMSAEEFEKAKTAVVEAARRATQRAEARQEAKQEAKRRGPG